MATFMIIDDSKMIRMQLKGALSSKGHETIEAENAEIGLKIAKENAEQISVIICDYNMPGRNGLDLIESMRQEESLKNTTVLMLSTESSPELKSRGKALGVLAWIVKPFNRETFLGALDKFLSA